MRVRIEDGREVSQTPEENISAATEYIINNYGDEMTYWEQEHHPETLPVPEREAWHRDAWDREQASLQIITSGQAGNDAPGQPRNFGYANPGVVHEQ